MSELALLLEILRGANLATPAIVSIIGTIRSGREAGKSDEDIKAESMAIALDTRAESERQMGDQP